MPQLAPPSFDGVSLAPDLRRVLEAAMRPAAVALNSALVVGDSLQVWEPVLVLGTGANSSALLPGPEAIAYCSTAQSIPSATTTVLNFDTVVEDTAAAISTGAAWKFTVPAGQGGTYLVTASATVAFAANVVFDYLLTLAVNGAEVWRPERRCGTIPASGGTLIGASASALLRLNAGDYVQAQLYQSSGAARSLESNSLDNRIAIARVR